MERALSVGVLCVRFRARVGGGHVRGSKATA